MPDDEEEFQISEEELQSDEEFLSEEREMEWSEESETPASNTARTKSKSTRKYTPAEVKNDNPVADVSRNPRKKRVFTEDVIDEAVGRIPNQPCAFCHHVESDVVGGFVSPFPFIGPRGGIYVHRSCALTAGDVARSSRHFYNVVKSVNRSRKTKCVHCNSYGATLCCAVTGCSKYCSMEVLSL